MKYIASPFIAFISLFGIHTASGQLAVISDQNINFSNAVSTISDGDWSSPSIWSGGVVPDASDDVVVNHTVYIDIQGANSGDIVDLCRNIKVAQDGVLRLGQQGGPSGHTWEKGVQYEDAFLYEWMDGKWLIEPDGSWGHAAYFLMSQWQQNPNNSITLNVKDIDTSKLCLYPNPSNEHFFIESSFESEVETSIYSLNGKLLKTIKHNTKTPISTKDLTIGTYAISVRTNEIALTKLLIINK